MPATSLRQQRACRVSLSSALLVGLVSGMLLPEAGAAEVRVTSDTELREALASAEAGTTILIAPGRYAGSLSRTGLHGTAEAPVVIAAEDPDNRPVFVGEAAGGRGAVALQLSSSSHVVLRDFIVRGFPGNGLNIDDGGRLTEPTHHITIEHMVVLETGPRGNHDGLKMSGVDQFTIRDCFFAGWGGSAIDFVGCHDGLVEGCRFEGGDGFSQANAVQIKGGSRGIRVLDNFFLEAGERAINLGGSTGLAYFRPEVGDSEATDVEVAGNRFVGGTAAVAWVTADGGHVHHNTFVDQEKWVLRILQENQDPRMHPCHDGLFEDNLIVAGDRVRVWVNVGPGTAPETFRFRRNAWYAEHEGRPQLPTVETDAVYGRGQPLTKPREAESWPSAGDGPLWDRGAHAYQGDQPQDAAPRPSGGFF